MQELATQRYYIHRESEGMHPPRGDDDRLPFLDVEADDRRL